MTQFGGAGLRHSVITTPPPKQGKPGERGNKRGGGGGDSLSSMAVAGAFGGNAEAAPAAPLVAVAGAKPGDHLKLPEFEQVRFGLGFGVWGLGFGVWGLGFGVGTGLGLVVVVGDGWGVIRGESVVNSFNHHYLITASNTPKPNQTKSNQTKPNQTKPNQTTPQTG